MRNQLDITLNILLFLFTIFIFIIIQSTLLNNYVFQSFGPDLCLLMIIYIGIRRDFWEGLIVSFVISYIVSVNGSGLQMLFLIHYLLVFIVSRFVGLAIYMDSYKDHIAAGGCLTLFNKLIIVAWAHLAAVPSVGHFLFSGFISSLINAALAPLLFLLFNWMDIITGRAEPEYVKNRPETVR
jgi:rod shape-determining protein MreD